ncbi:peroxisomal membrane protein PEX14 isoform X2 [Lingula anatina]|uniref:Peroxisomal membrane protein PEX14 n=1 Tax=Lingula anatina TaxID=7574 RepID=A0A1S3K205_LINAN|nr:peroxisomal membrane protein PEX14 isoform X1 [Lingula anatina]XP_013416668.1 peroxisomal membrane protein PEX14 isoform X2 [Lingula anatina]|eukprot:XP_013416661.1 peroxisomal membrane protein PEX14 isoform X1 [Lingula anatina]
MAEEGEKMSETESVPVLPPEVRQSLVGTAVKFLQNPKVLDTPLSRKKAFLEKKGLTSEEIELAIKTSGTPLQDIPQHSQQVQVIAPLPTWWTRVKDIAIVTLIAGGGAYWVYRLFKEAILPWIRGDEPKAKKYERLETSMAAIQELLSQQQEKIQDISHAATNRQTGDALVRQQDTQSLNEIKQEIISLKGLLLNKKQFPAAPVQTPITLPSWQLASSSSPTLTTTAAEMVTTFVNSENGTAATKTVSAEAEGATGDAAATSVSPVECEDGQEVKGQSESMAPIETSADEEEMNGKNEEVD